MHFIVAGEKTDEKLIIAECYRQPAGLFIYYLFIGLSVIVWLD